ncbi:MAG: GNAT family N-acetyltransferase [Anaeroplasmataceae bacterium]|nr:GNAT family N-acetyltransferase [Anaeroplasmataceae bacterium]
MDLSVKTYLNNPCGTLSIPYWKAKNLVIPDSIVILHHTQFQNQFNEYQSFFRLLHPLNEAFFPSCEIKTISALEDVLPLLNVCFEKEDINLSISDLIKMQEHPVYNRNLWVGIEENGNLIACGIAEFDVEINEGIIEWLCVLPNYQRKGIGRKIVNELCYRLKEFGATFVTVSGRIGNTSNPESFYRSCGFLGSDVWYICEK